MFSAGIDVDSRLSFSLLTAFIGVPTAVKLSNWAVSGAGAAPLSSLFSLSFAVGGASGLLLSNAHLDLSLHDSYFVIAHFHVVLSLSSLVGTLLALCALTSPSSGAATIFPTASLF
jgi:heme/copper-type cytochrome/quinol oxidase subunit 1